MPLNELLDYLHQFLQVSLFKDYCPNGLQVEGRAQVQRIVSGVTACQALLETAAGLDADAILVHHGFFWNGEDPRIVGIKRRRIETLLRHDMSLLAYHLPLDAHPTVGNNARLAALLDFVEADAGANPVPVTDLLRRGELRQAMSVAQFQQHLTARLLRAPLHISGSSDSIRRVAWCTGAAQSYIQQAVELPVDAFVSGEISEQTVHVARESGIHYFAAGHHATERYGVQALGEHLAQQFGIEHHFIDIDNPV